VSRLDVLEGTSPRLLCDTPSVTVAATMIYGTSTVYLGLSSILNSNHFFDYY
jgi:hypothetical protein